VRFFSFISSLLLTVAFSLSVFENLSRQFCPLLREKMSVCYTDSDCHDNGDCINGACMCIGFYYGSDCALNGIQIIGPYFNIWRGFVVLSFSFIFAYSIASLGRQIRREDNKLTMPFSVQNICLVFVFLFSLVRIIYFLCDPWNLRKRMPTIVANYLRNLPIPFLLTMYLLVLIVWVEIYHGKSKLTPGRVLGKLRPLFIVVIIITYILFAIAIPFYETPQRSIVYVWAAWLVIFLVVLAVGFTVYGIRLYRKLSGGIVVVSKKHKEMLTKLTRFAVACSIIDILSVLVAVGLAIGEETSQSPLALLAGYTVAYFLENVWCWLVVLTLRQRGDGSSDASASYSHQGSSSRGAKQAASFRESLE